MAKAKYKRGKDGFFRTKIWDGTYNADGTKHRKNLSSDKSSADLERQVNALKNQVAQAAYVPPADILFPDYARQWLKVYKASCGDKTIEMYDRIIEKHLAFLDSVRLQDIQRIHFQQAINNAMEHPRTCEQISLTFRQIVKSAIRDRLLPQGAFELVCEGITSPRYRAPEKRPLTPLERSVIPKADFSPRERCFVYLIYGCGLRREEALALKPSDIDWGRRTIRISRALIFLDNNGKIKETKSANGVREIPMPSFLSAFLQSYAPGCGGGHLIRKLNGGAITKSSYRKMWESIIRKMNAAAGGTKASPVICDLTAHVFRHNYCTQLCYRIPEISIKKIAQLMGDTERMVLDVYNHILEERENPEKTVENAIHF